MLNVTETFLPPIEEYIAYLKKAWDNKWITNNGFLVQELEQKLKNYLGVKHLLFTGNGTIVLQMALKALKPEPNSEIITTPFSYVATTNAILWENLTPVFVDINTSDYNIDVSKIEEKITTNTAAILATHVYGNPCNIETIQEIAARNSLKVIYDAAHAFGSTYKEKQILQYGDISTCSFHATKVFHTVEGGCIVTNDDEIFEKLKLMRQFGHVGDDYFTIGINGKNSEFHAAMGLANFKYIDEIINNRKQVSNWYDKLLINSGLIRPLGLTETNYNYSYYPVLFPNEDKLLEARQGLLENQINTRRYFFPSLDTLPFISIKHECPISNNVSKRALALPLSSSTSIEDVQKICNILIKILSN